jgi:hypothetical protein
MDGGMGGPTEGRGNFREARVGQFPGKVGAESTGQHDPAMSTAREEFVSIHADLLADDFEDPR